MGRQSKTDAALLAALAYVPFLLSSPGRVSADSKQALYLEPGRFLSRAADLWDPSIGAGTVPHQHLGYLFPTGPWFWALDRLGVPDWVAQRLWLGTISLAAALGARWLFRQLGTGRAGALAGALVYVLTPYQLAFTARMSVILLPWAALPWLVGLTMRATRTRDWRAPAAFALVVLAVGGVNASSLLLVGVAPALWLVHEAVRSREAAVRVLTATGRMALLSLGLAAWWLVGLRVQGTHGLPVLQLTENVRTVAEASTPGDVMRGLGNWFFYGRDRTGFSLDQAADYADRDLVVLLSYAVPVLALAAAFLLRWAHRSYFALLMVVGTVIAVGSWPYDDPSPYGSLWKAFTGDTSLGLAFRNSPRVVPIVVLGCAGLLAAAVGGLPRPRWRQLGGGVVALVAVGALLPVWGGGFLTDGMTRPEEVPDHWRRAAELIDAGDQRTRVLEIPGASFAAYSWGTTVEPVTPGLTDRPYLAREVLPIGTPATVNLLTALDRRMQLGTLEPAALPALARLLGVGTISLRADLDQSGRFGFPPIEPLWAALTDPTPEGLAEPVALGPPGGAGADPSLPSVALFEVEDPRPIVRTAPVEGAVVMAGDGEGIVDLAAAGLIDGTTLVLPTAPLDDAMLREALDSGAHLVLTDSHRRRRETWFYTLRDDKGPTERAGGTEPDPTGYDHRLDPYPGSTDDTRSVVVQHGGQVSATGGGGPEHPEDRSAHAVDGDTATAWRVAGADARGAALTLVPDDPVTTDRVQILQSGTDPGARALATVAVRVNGGDPITVELGTASRSAPGQAVTFPRQEVSAVSVEIVQTSPAAPTDPSAAPVGIAELRLGEVVIDEVVRLPVDLMQRVGDRAADLSLDVVLTRLRWGWNDPGRVPEETHLDREVTIPTARSFGLVGLVRESEPGSFDGSAVGGACRDDLVRIDDRPVPVRLVDEPGGDPSRGLRVEGCAPVALDAGAHRITTTGGAGGLDVDRLVLSSVAGGGPDVGPLLREQPAGEVGLEVQRDDPGALDLVTADHGGEPFWLVLGQSHSSGWEPSVTGGEADEQALVDGYANGWLVTPSGEGEVAIELRWTPQRIRWVGFGVSGATLLACAAILWRTRSRREASVVGVGATPLAAKPGVAALRDRARSGDHTSAVTAGAATLAAGLVFADVEIGLLGAVAVGGAALVPRSRPLLAVVAPAALLAARVIERPSLGWLPVLLLLGDLVTQARIERATRTLAGSSATGRSAPS